MSSNGLVGPAWPQNFDSLPGNEVCVSCRLFYGLLILLIELPLVYWATDCIARWQAVHRRCDLGSCDQDDTEHKHGTDETNTTAEGGWSPLLASAASGESSDQSSPCYGLQANSSATWLLRAAGALGCILAALGWLYWLTVFAVYWNFVSYLLLIGPALVGPPLLISYCRSAPGPVRDALVIRRLRLGGWVVGLLALVLFQNVALIPQQVQRHLDKSSATITPTHALVQQLRDQFLTAYPTYHNMTFVHQMAKVDDFIKETILWRESMSLYHMIGLLASPADAIDKRAGDCQAQAVTTASLLFALGGVQAYCVETPFHWWTHAVSLETGQTYNLNVHGSAGLDGSVTPQPVDLMYTWFPPRCVLGTDPNCNSVDAWNMETVTYVAPPPRALAIALVGMHEFRRDIAPIFDGKAYLLLLIGAGVALGIALYASYFQEDCALGSGFLRRLWKRTVVSLPASLTAMVLMYGWSYLYYPVVLIHLIGCIVLCFIFTSSDGYNASIGTPPPSGVKSAPTSSRGCPNHSLKLRESTSDSVPMRRSVPKHAEAVVDLI